MDWEQLREKTVGEVATSLITSGAGVAGGFIGAAVVGRQIQNRIKSDSDVTADPSMANKVVAWSANNIPKLVIYYLTRGYSIMPGEAVTPTKEAVSDARKAMAGSVVFDTLMRLANSGVNPATADIWNYQVMSGRQKSTQKSMQTDVQRLVQENSTLKTELNKAMQKLTTQTQIGTSIQQPMMTYTPVTPATSTPMTVEPISPVAPKRQREYGFMQDTTPPTTQGREKRFGFMTGESKDVATMFGML